MFDYTKMVFPNWQFPQSLLRARQMTFNQSSFGRSLAQKFSYDSETFSDDTMLFLAFSKDLLIEIQALGMFS